MLKIRLQRVGRKNDPSFRVVVVDSKRGPKSGDNIELLGSYNPHINNVQVDGDRVKHWMSVGAQVSDTVHNLLVSEKIIEGKKVNVLPKKSPIKKAEEPKGDESPAGSGKVKAEDGKKEEAPAEEAKAEEPKEEPKPEETKEAEAVADLSTDVGVPSEGGKPEAPKEEEKKAE
jgi:small subunit ribosomal protein S16